MPIAIRVVTHGGTAANDLRGSGFQPTWIDARFHDGVEMPIGARPIGTPLPDLSDHAVTAEFTGSEAVSRCSGTVSMRRFGTSHRGRQGLSRDGMCHHVFQLLGGGVDHAKRTEVRGPWNTTRHR